MARQVITRENIDEAIRLNNSELLVGPDAIITSLAAEWAQEHGVRIVRDGEQAPQPAGPGALVLPLDEQTDPSTVSTEEVRKAVIAKLGSEPAQLDAVIARVLGD